ncbi:MAG: aminoglycoside phosphotransferase family protein [Anaerolineae bacterium]|nr:aminoglycoside phosphotransferase family protein [Anaerolineae bacterium]
MEYPTIETVTAIMHKHGAALGLESISHVETAAIGQGEANRNVLVTVDKARDFNVRIGLRDKESERTLQGEFNVLQRVPEGIGPQAFVVDFTRAEMAAPYMVLEYVAGAVKQTWDRADLEAHARTLARLHRQKFNVHGAVGQLSDASYDFLHRFDVAVEYWRTHHPYLLEIPIVQRLLPRIRHYIAGNNDLFTGLRRFCLVHGDAHPQNILFDGDRLRYIDWEWAVVGDPACDIAMIGWDIPTHWQMELTGERLEEFIEAYLALEPDDTLRRRRDVWMVYTMYFDHIYHRTQIAADTTGRQLYTVQQIEGYLVERFLE